MTSCIQVASRIALFFWLPIDLGQLTTTLLTSTTLDLLSSMVYPIVSVVSILIYCRAGYGRSIGLEKNQGRMILPYYQRF